MNLLKCLTVNKYNIPNYYGMLGSVGNPQGMCMFRIISFLLNEACLLPTFENLNKGRQPKARAEHHG